jgi:hypothetical protein
MGRPGTKACAVTRGCSPGKGSDGALAIDRSDGAEPDMAWSGDLLGAALTVPAVRVGIGVPHRRDATIVMHSTTVGLDASAMGEADEAEASGQEHVATPS